MLKTIAGYVTRWGKEFLWVACGQLLAVLGAFAAIKLLSLRLGPAGYGELALGLAIAGTLQMFVYGPVEQTVLRFVAEYREQGALPRLARSIGRLHGQLGTGLLVAALIAGFAVSGAAGAQWGWLAAAAIIFGIAGGASSSANAFLTGLRERRIVALHSGIDPWLRLAVALFALSLAGYAGHVALIGFALGTGLVALSAIITARLATPHLKESGPAYVEFSDEQWRARLFQYGGPFVAFAVFGAVSAYADRWLILVRFDSASVGIYAALLQIANAPIAILASMVNQLTVPVVFERSPKPGSTPGRSGAARLIRINLAAFVAISLVFTILAFTLGPWLAAMLTTQEFAVHGDILWILVLAVTVAHVGQALVLTGLSLGASGRYLHAKAIQAAAFILSGLILPAWFGLKGMAWALCFSSFCYLISVIIANRRGAAPAAG